MYLTCRSLLNALVAACCFAVGLSHAKEPPESSILFENVRIFDGKTTTLSPPSNLLVRGNTIQKISADPITLEGQAGTVVIKGEGHTLMPGLIDAHWHATMAALPLQVLMTADIGYINLAAGKQAQATLMRGFTSVRDLSGPTFGLKRAIDDGLVEGPRIWPSGAMISQTGGHGDFRLPYEVPTARNAPLNRGEAINGGVIADGPDEVRKRVREQLMLGASQIKLAAGGGVSSFYDPIDVSQYTEAEFRAAVEAAENWGTYVTVHAYTPRAIKTAIAGGVKSIDHGHLLDEETVKLMAEKGIWLTLQPFLDNEFSNPQTGEARVKQLQVYAGTDNAYKLAQKHNLKLAWGTDILFNPRMVNRQGAILASMTRWYEPAEVLRMATSTNAELLQLSGPRNPYAGNLGVIEEGALADLLLVDGNPIDNIQLIADPDKNFVVIMKDGKVYKNSVKQ
ncbi:amidohydrolase family protein [Marinobacter sp. NFXS11]|uniref:metal-dependent hydrolase family protein n=1 Tax=Marinobacter sp. NFXS11 TaxID=2818432 RepID=UPI0032DFC379